MSNGYESDNQHFDGPGRGGQLDRVLAELMSQAPEVEAAAVVSFDGLPMASALPHGMDEDRVAAMSAALLSLGERAAQGLGRGDLNQVYVEGQSGTVFLVSADDEAVLVAVGARGAKVGLMLFEVRQAAERVAAVLREVPDPGAEPVLEPAEVMTQVPTVLVAVPEPAAAETPVPEAPAAQTSVPEEPAAQTPVPVASVPVPEPVVAVAPMNELPPAPAPVEALPPVPVPVAEPVVEPVTAVAPQPVPTAPAATANGGNGANGANGSSGLNGVEGSWPVYPSTPGESSSWS